MSTTERPPTNPATTERTGGELLIECLVAQGASVGFGVPGESYLAVLDALHDSPLELITTRNEGGASYMAEAWGKLTGEPGICFVTRGPGATNASVGIHTAMQDSTPVLMFVGQVATDQFEREAFQEIDYRRFYGSVAKWATQIESADRIPEIVSRAWSTALSGRPGPVVVALPEDMLTTTTTVPPCAPVRIAEPAPRPNDIERATALLSGAERPLIIAGGGAWSQQGKDDLQAWAEATGIPLLVVFRSNDLIDNHSPIYCGAAEVGMFAPIQQMIRDADVVVGAGIRFGEIATGGYTLFDVPNPTQRIIHAHASDRELGKVYAAEVPIHAGPNAFASALLDAQREQPVDGTSWSQWRTTARAGYLERLIAGPQPGDLDMGEVCRWLQDRLPSDVVCTNGAGNFSAWPNKFLQYGPEARLLGPQSGSMGAGLPAAIAAKIAHPERMVICWAGDGDFQMNLQELGTAMQAGAQPIVLVVNNGMYGTIRMHQEHHYPKRVSGTEIINPSFAMLARAYGFHGEVVERTEDFPDAFERAAASPTGAILDLMVDPESLSPGKTLAEATESGLQAQLAEG